MVMVCDDVVLQWLVEYGVCVFKFDVVDVVSVFGLVWQVDGEWFDVVVINVGVFGLWVVVLQMFMQVDFDVVMYINVFGFMCVLLQVVEVLVFGVCLVIIFLCMGFIGLCIGSSGWFYCVFKVVVNLVMKDVVLVLVGKVIVISFYLGWVCIDMGGGEVDIDFVISIVGMCIVLVSVKLVDLGSFFNYDGQLLVW